MKLIAFDPGGTTGVARYMEKRDFQGFEHRSLWTYELQSDPHHLKLENLLYSFCPDVIITERFDYRPNQKHAELISVEYIGVMKLWSQKYDVELVQQDQFKGDKGLWTDDKLKVLGLHKSTKGGHSNDAVRQMLHYVTSKLKDEHYLHEYRRLKDGDD